MDPIQPKSCAEKLNALAAPERLKILRFLSNGPKNVSEIAEMLKTAAVNVAHHMNVLLQAKLVKRRKEGRFVYYYLVQGLHQPGVNQDGIEFFNLGCCRLEVPKQPESE